MISEVQYSRSDRVILTSCSYDCGARCLLKVHIKDGEISHIGTDMRPMSSLKACRRGLAQRELVYAPDRLTKPLKRGGKRGEGRYEPISWEEALEKVSSEFLRVKNDFGNSAIWYHPDSQRVDQGGCVNVLTKDDRSPSGAFPCNSCLVQVERCNP
jgi:anaerobic selenocysteine-containing dehydrogenase